MVVIEWNVMRALRLALPSTTTLTDFRQDLILLDSRVSLVLFFKFSFSDLVIGIYLIIYQGIKDQILMS